VAPAYRQKKTLGAKKGGIGEAPPSVFHFQEELGKSLVGGSRTVCESHHNHRMARRNGRVGYFVANGTGCRIRGRRRPGESLSPGIRVDPSQHSGKDARVESTTIADRLVPSTLFEQHFDTPRGIHG
jgi:hypothetical protein